MGLKEQVEMLCKVYFWLYFKISFYNYFQSSKIGVLALIIKDFGLKNNMSNDTISYIVLITVSISLIINEFLDFKFLQKRMIKIILEILSFAFTLVMCLNYLINTHLQLIGACFLLTTNFCSTLNLIYDILPTWFRQNLIMIICLTVIYSAKDFLNFNSINTTYSPYQQQALLFLAGMYGFSQFVNFFLKRNINITSSPHNNNELVDFLYTQEIFEKNEQQQINKCKKISIIFLIFIVGLNINYYSIANLTQNYSLSLEIIWLLCFQLLFQFVLQVLVKTFPILDLTNIIVFINTLVVAQLQLVKNNMYLRNLFLAIIFGQPLIFQKFFRSYTGFIQPHKWIKIILAVFMLSYAINDIVVKYLIVGETNYSSTLKEVDTSFQAYQIVQNCLSLGFIVQFEVFLKKKLPQSYQRSILNLQL